MHILFIIITTCSVSAIFICTLLYDFATLTVTIKIISHDRSRLNFTIIVSQEYPKTCWTHKNSVSLKCAPGTESVLTVSAYLIFWDFVTAFDLLTLNILLFCTTWMEIRLNYIHCISNICISMYWADCPIPETHLFEKMWYSHSFKAPLLR